MNEQLSKLTKKDGVKVGYFNLEGANPCYGFEIGNYFYGADEFEQMLQNLYGSDIFLSDLESHRFVTKDKNGKDVFAGDTVKAGNWFFEVIWQKYGYGLKGKKSGWWRQFHEFEHIELAFEGVELIEEEK